MSKGNLLWSFDEGSGSFAPLPAGPLLIPALVIYGLLRLFSGGGGTTIPAHRMLPRHIIESAEYRRDCARYRYLWDKRCRFGDLDPIEWIELQGLEHPAWYGGKRWLYD